MKDEEEYIRKCRGKVIPERTRKCINVQRQDAMWIHSGNTKYFYLSGAGTEE